LVGKKRWLENFVGLEQVAGLKQIVGGGRFLSVVKDFVGDGIFCWFGTNRWLEKTVGWKKGLVGKTCWFGTNCWRREILSVKKCVWL